MAFHVCNGAMLQCSFGMMPSALIVTPVNRVMTGGMPAANIMDNVPMMNVPTFGLCMTPSNPAVAAATAAALGVLTPMPCIPVTTAPWAPGSPTVLSGGMPALNSTSQLMCMWGGLIQITSPGQMTEMVA
jgi:hypothetical protein